MAVTTTDSTLNLTKWRRDYWVDWSRKNLFAPYMGNDEMSVIHRLYELKDGGEEIVVPLVGSLQGDGVSSDNTLVGNEEALDQYGQKVRIDWRRHAVVLNKKQMRRSAIDQMSIVRPRLMDRSMKWIRDDIIKALHNIGTIANTGTVNGVYYPNASAAQKNAWHDANSDRVVYGNLTSNFTAGNHAASLANVNNTTGKLTAAGVRLMKRRARKTTNTAPSMTPIRVDDGREYFVMFAGSNAFRDLNNDAEVLAMNTNARPREGRGMDDNPLFQDGDLLINGVIVREIPEIENFATIAGVGGSGINVAPVWLCGAQALIYAVGQLPAPTERYEDDYQFIKGRGIETCYGVAKTQKQASGTSTLKDWSVSTGFYASVGD